MASWSRQSLDLIEVYRIIYQGPDINLRGVILSCDSETGFQFLFKPAYVDDCDARDVAIKYVRTVDYLMEGNNNELDTSKPFVKSDCLIMLNGPTEASIGVGTGCSIEFHLFGDMHRFMNFPRPCGIPKVLAVPLSRVIESDDGNKVLTVLYAFFENAVEAHVKVKLSGIKSDFGLHGLISARTSAIRHPAYSSILFFNKSCDKMIVGRENEMVIPLSRPLVGVPLGSTLFLDINLSGDDNGMKVQERLPIDVNNDSTKNDYSRTISCDNYVIKVEIEWKFERKPGPVRPSLSFESSSSEEDNAETMSIKD